MALFTVNLPILAELMADYHRFLDGRVPTDFKRTVTYHFTSGQYKVHIAGVLCFCEMASSRLKGTGTVSITRHDESWIYHGEWYDGNVRVQSFDSTICAISGEKLIYHDGSKDVTFSPVRARRGASLLNLEDGHIGAAEANLEFPVLPGQHLRLCAGDGEYVQLNADAASFGPKVYTEISGVRIYRITRTFGAVDQNGQVVQGFLDLSEKKQTIYWNLNGMNSQAESDLSSAEKKSKFLAWLSSDWSDPLPWQRNLLRVLGLTVPCMVWPKGIAADSPEAAC